ncbi:uncharacterized protein LOC127279903 [Leptopilina boulardi]|uniref:uncharacterized protein LOC127279903 n=1 Tax=Leptopilina boulardi TaxID=63433 RepID=UPI0021F65D28|nr:uncharacterized protein LOC127279903 [Leptopilina boulardi]
MFHGLVYWPSRDELHATMPTCFQESFGDSIAIIIDCFEIFTETPSNLLTAAQCWSHYKHHETVKVLIGITPQGTISFISEAFGGRISDKQITKDSGILDHLIPQDVVLADRGFLIEDLLTPMLVTLKMPAFTKGKSQLHPLELEETRKIAHVRIHVERVIGALRQKFGILHDTLTIAMLATTEGNVSQLDKIIRVCAALYNLNTSIIS